MLSAAIFIGAAADKFYPVNLDQIINLNTYLGVNTYTYQRSGKERILNVTYFQFKDPDQDPSGNLNGWFAYELGMDACLSGTEWDLLVNNDGTFSVGTVQVFDFLSGGGPGVDLRGDNGVAITVCREGSPLDEVCDNPATNSVYGPALTDIGCGGANWFAQAAEDARKTIWYLHNYEAPEDAY